MGWQFLMGTSCLLIQLLAVDPAVEPHQLALLLGAGLSLGLRDLDALAPGHVKAILFLRQDHGHPTMKFCSEIILIESEIPYCHNVTLWCNT